MALPKYLKCILLVVLYYACILLSYAHPQQPLLIVGAGGGGVKPPTMSKKYFRYGYSPGAFLTSLSRSKFMTEWFRRGVVGGGVGGYVTHCCMQGVRWPYLPLSRGVPILNFHTQFD